MSSAAASTAPTARPPGLWVTALLGVSGGLGAAGLLAVSTLAQAAVLVGGLAAGVLILVAPHAGLYVTASAMIAQWGGGELRLASTALAGSALLWALTVRRALVPRDILLPVMALLVAVIWLSALRTGGSTASGIALTYTGFLVFYWTVSTLANAPAVVTRLVVAMVVAGLITATIGFAQYRFQFGWAWADHSPTGRFGPTEYDPVAGLRSEGGLFRIDSVTGQPDSLGLIMQILIPFAFVWMARQTSPWRRAAGATAVGALALAMLLSFTRGVMVTAVLITVPFLAARIGWRRSLPYLAAGAALVGMLLASWPPARDRVLSPIGDLVAGDRSTSAGWRRELLGVSSQIFLDHFWTGVGLGQEKLARRQYASSEELLQEVVGELIPLHNAYLSLGTEVGVGGIGLLLLTVVAAWVQLRRLHSYFRATGQTGLLDLALAAEAAWVALAVNAAMYPGLDTFRYFWLLLAVIGGLARVAADQRSGDRRMIVRGGR